MIAVTVEEALGPTSRDARAGARAHGDAQAAIGALVLGRAGREAEVAAERIALLLLPAREQRAEARIGDGGGKGTERPARNGRVHPVLLGGALGGGGPDGGKHERRREQRRTSGRPDGTQLPQETHSPPIGHLMGVAVLS